MDNKTRVKWQDYVADVFDRAKIVITEAEKKEIEIADFGLSDFEKFGLSILTYINTDKVCAKEMVLLPNQICPEHRHPSVGSQSGKEETFRCRKGKVYLYLPFEKKNKIKMNLDIPKGSVFTVFKEVVLHEGEQYTIFPDTLHWFRGGPEGAIVSEFSTQSTDEHDIFSDPNIVR